MTTRAGQALGSRSILGRIALLAVLVSSCGVLGGPTEAETIEEMISTVEAAQGGLSRAVSLASSSGQTMSAEAQAAIQDTEQALIAFKKATSTLGGNDQLASAAEGYAQSANLVLGLLQEGDIDVAAEVARTQVDVKYSALSNGLNASQAELGRPRSSNGVTRIVLVAVIIAGVAAVALARMRPATKEDTSSAAPPRRLEDLAQFPPGSLPEDPLSSLSSTLPPIGSEPPKAPEPTGPLRNPEARHSVKGGLRTVELEGIIEAALATVTNTGWEVAIQCPQVRVLVDPLRMRRLLSNLLLSATAHGAEHIGLVAEIVGDKVEVNVGHDGTLLANEDPNSTSSQVPPEVEHQLTVARQLLVGMHADVRWSRWRGVSLYTVELVRGPEEVNHPGELAQMRTD